MLHKQIGNRLRADGRFDMIGDWWGICHQLPKQLAGAVQSDVQDALLLTTTKHAIIATYARQGFMSRVSEDKTHNITDVLSR